MLVRQLIGPYAGQIQEMPFVVAQSCISMGTACLPDDSPRVKGLKIVNAEPAAKAGRPKKAKKAKKVGHPFGR